MSQETKPNLDPASDLDDEVSSEFEKILKILKELQDQENLFISLVPPFDISVKIDKEIRQEKLKQAEIDEKVFKNDLRKIETFILVSILGEQNSYIENVLERTNIRGPKAEEKRKEINEAIKKVEEKLVNERLKQRYFLKASSKAPSFHSLDWDIKLKIKDAQIEKISFPYATCKFRYQREFSESPLNLIGGKTFDSVQINFSGDEIDYLIKQLEIIKKNISQAEDKYGQ
ncbi:hypothetical protein NITGR_240004 [Nitrospina gracilis 3/211]|uniref:COMM domain-containing protein n=1 Tax=Nitrospina gracilis (strain 3/211) TaxID=1266370 RepID=M1YHW2_NITG3|nr:MULTISPECIES: hypothetical protein [Nitrospina]MCF8723052.1 hypothetical protein [Nitrospina sp. Nb-3]CCQ90085.1 hypothetical protein NITGR_240004 [Nitrospina gracilis 3/211]